MLFLMNKNRLISTLNVNQSRNFPITSKKDLKKERQEATVQTNISKSEAISHFIQKELVGEPKRFDHTNIHQWYRWSWQG